MHELPPAIWDALFVGSIGGGRRFYCEHGTRCPHRKADVRARALVLPHVSDEKLNDFS